MLPPQETSRLDGLQAAHARPEMTPTVMGHYRDIQQRSLQKECFRYRGDIYMLEENMAYSSRIGDLGGSVMMCARGRVLIYRRGREYRLAFGATDNYSAPIVCTAGECNRLMKDRAIPNVGLYCAWELDGLWKAS